VFQPNSRQRRKENKYLVSTGQTPNMIFHRAAIAAGFKGLSDLSFYLRSLISRHHDTLAVKVN